MSILKDVIEMTEKINLGKRDSWEEYFLSLSYIASLRSTCGSRRVGAVVISGLEKGKRKVVSTGYNGNPPGEKHCFEGGCPRFKARQEGLIESGVYSDEFPCYAIHAEDNALRQMKEAGISTKGCVLFSTTFPCIACAKKVVKAEIKEIYYAEGYPDKESELYLKENGIQVSKLNI